MAQRHGMQGKVLIEEASITELVDFTLNINSGVAESNKIGGTWTRSTYLSRKASASISCNYDPDDTVMAALITGFTTGDVEFSSVALYDNASAYFGGQSAILTSASVTKSYGGYDKFNASFDYKETLTYA